VRIELRGADPLRPSHALDARQRVEADRLHEGLPVAASDRPRGAEQSGTTAQQLLVGQHPRRELGCEPGGRALEIGAPGLLLTRVGEAPRREGQCERQQQREPCRAACRAMGPTP